MFSWFDTLKIIRLSVIGFIVFLICLRILIVCNPFRRIAQQIEKKTKIRESKENNKGHEMDSMLPKGVEEPPFTREISPLALIIFTSHFRAKSTNRTRKPSAPRRENVYPVKAQMRKWEQELYWKSYNTHVRRWLWNGKGRPMYCITNPNPNI